MRLVLGLLAAAVLCLAATPMASAEKRIALVIGNAEYRGGAFGRLTNPLNDAGLMTTTLTALGFEVETVPNATEDQMEEAIGRLGERLGAAGKDAVGLFYFAGHGYLSQGRNYMIPVDARARTEQAVWNQAPSIGMVEEYMGFAGNRVNFIIFDACRNNDLPVSVRGGNAQQLVDTKASGLMYLFASKPGTSAKDGGGTNSPFTLALAKYLNTRGLMHNQVFNRVTDDVYNATGGEQQPWIEGSILGGDFCFTDCTAPATVTVEREVIRYVEAKPAPALSLVEEKSASVAGSPYNVSMSQDGGRLAGWGVSGRTATLQYPGSTEKMINVKTGAFEDRPTATAKPSLTLSGHANDIVQVEFSKDGSRIITGSDDKTARIWDAATGKTLFKLTGATERVGAVAFSQDGTRAVTSANDFRIWDTTTGKPVATWPRIGYGPANRLVLSPDNARLLAIVSSEAHVIDLVTGKNHKLAAKTEQKPGAPAPVTRYTRIMATDLSADGKFVVTGSAEGELRTWDAATGDLIRTLDGHPDTVTGVAWSPDGALILSISEDKTLQLWDTLSGKSVARQYSGAFNGFIEAHFSADGQRIVATDRSTVKTWRIERPEPAPPPSEPSPP
jgi:uncharacterized caspase-like protein